MKKLFFILSVAILSLTGCHHSDDFDFLLGENAIGVEFYYDEVEYESLTVQEQFTRLLDTRKDAIEFAFLDELNDEIDEVHMIAHRFNPTSVVVPDVNYTFRVFFTEITDGGVIEANVHVFDNQNREVRTFVLNTHRELDRSFTERIFDSTENLGERLGHNIRYGI